VLHRIFVKVAAMSAVGSAVIATGASAAPPHRHSYIQERAGLILSSSGSRALANGSPTTDCKVVGTISHRCLSFNSDSIWREGLPDYYGSN
jgi:hypothetical protein